MFVEPEIQEEEKVMSDLVEDVNTGATQGGYLAEEMADREDRRTVGDPTVDNPRMRISNVNVYYDEKHAIKKIRHGADKVKK